MVKVKVPLRFAGCEHIDSKTIAGGYLQADFMVAALYLKQSKSAKFIDGSTRDVDVLLVCERCIETGQGNLLDETLAVVYGHLDNIGQQDLN